MALCLHLDEKFFYLVREVFCLNLSQKVESLCNELLVYQFAKIIKNFNCLLSSLNSKMKNEQLTILRLWEM
jgi:hypothetical protein